MWEGGAEAQQLLQISRSREVRGGGRVRSRAQKRRQRLKAPRVYGDVWCRIPFVLCLRVSSRLVLWGWGWSWSSWAWRGAWLLTCVIFFVGFFGSQSKIENREWVPLGLLAIWWLALVRAWAWPLALAPPPSGLRWPSLCLPSPFPLLASVAGCCLVGLLSRVFWLHGACTRP